VYYSAFGLLTAKAPGAASFLRQISPTDFHIAELAAFGPWTANEGLFHENRTSAGLRSFARCPRRGARRGFAVAGHNRLARRPSGLGVASLPQACRPAWLRASGQAVAERAPRSGSASSRRRRLGRRPRRRHRALRGRRGGSSGDHHRPRGRIAEQLWTSGQRTRRGRTFEQGPSHRSSENRPLPGITVPSLGSAEGGGLRQPARLRHGSPAVCVAAPGWCAVAGRCAVA